MIVEQPVEILHLPQKLRELFAGKLAESVSGSAMDRERNYLSRALAAYSIHKLSGASIEDAAMAIVDGGGDGGIDAVYYSASGQVLWVVQSKFMADGRGEPSLGDVTKFKVGLENLLQGNFGAFKENAAWTKLVPSLGIYFKNSTLIVRPLLVYSGIHLVSEDRKRLFDDLKRRFSPESDYLDIQFCNLTTIHDWLTGADQGPGVDRVELTLLKPGWVKSPYETIFGLVPLKDLALLYVEAGPRLVAANIRGFKGNTDVNEQIVTTITDEPRHFFYLNNGLTAYCRRLEINNFDRDNAEAKRITAHGLSVVNGAQTLGSISKVLEKAPASAQESFCFIKIISLEKCEDDRAFAERVARSTNFQNQIGLRDFAAQHEQQEIIARQLMLSGVTYHYKADVETPSADSTNFTFEEATTACACLMQEQGCDCVARCLSNRSSLWDLEDAYPETELLRSRYSRVFRPDRSARTVWRAVQAQRLVIAVMRDGARVSKGIRKAFFENARWLVLNVLLLKLRPEQGEALTLTDDEGARITAMAQDLSETLFTVCEEKGFVARKSNVAGGQEPYDMPRHFRSIFCAAGDCQILRNALLARLAPAASTKSASPADPSSGT